MTMSAQDAICQFSQVARDFADQRTPEGLLVPGKLRVPRALLRDLAACSRADWEAHHWTVHERELQALQGSDAYFAAGTLKGILNRTDVGIVSIEVLEEGPLEIAPVFARELGTYLRELPRLLAEGKAGQFAVVHGSDIVSIWATFGEALQEGHERFGPGNFMAQHIDPRDPDRLAVWFIPKEAVCRS
jgi:hypothetical protein